MKLLHPFIITPRLLPGLRIGNGYVQLEYSARPGTKSRVRYRWTIDIGGLTGPDDGGWSGDDLQSGCQGGGLQEGFESMLDFLSAFAEGLRYGPRSDNYDIFPEALADWAMENSDELGRLSYEIGETPDLIEE